MTLFETTALHSVLSLFEITIAREIEDRSGEAISLGKLGDLYIHLGQVNRAIYSYNKALAIIREIGDLQSEISALNSLGLALSSKREYKNSIIFYDQALNIARNIGDRYLEASSLRKLGYANTRLGLHEKAISILEESQAIEREIGDRIGEAGSYHRLGIAYRELGQYKNAAEYLMQGLKIARTAGNRLQEANLLYSQARLYLRTDRYSDAEFNLREVINIYESLRDDLSDEHLISIADTQANAYKSLEQTVVMQNNFFDALTAVERGRAQAFALQLKSHRTATDNLTTTPTFPEIQQIAHDTNTTLVTYSLIFNQILNIYVIQPNGNLQLRSVPLTDNSNPNLTAGLITNLDGPLYRNAPPSELNTLITDNRRSLYAIVNDDLQTNQLKDLHKLLIAPITYLLPTDPTAKVAFIPTDKLFLVPFAALQDENGTHLIEKHTILTAPSIQVYGLANDAAATKPLNPNPINALIVGDPTMPTIPVVNDNGEFTHTQLKALSGARKEAQAVGKTLNTQPLIGNQATEAQVKQQLPSADLIHLATHGLLQYGNPQAYGTLDFPGAIALAPSDGEDGLLTSAELLEMDLQASLAILSACDTGRGRITGDGVVGLSRSLITAGVPSVIVSLWAVPDAPTAELMTEFYNQLSQGQDKAQALRQAMLITMKNHPSPRDWAAFTLMGSGS